MRTTRGLLLSSLAILATSSAAASAAPEQTGHLVLGARAATTTIDPSTGVAATTSSVLSTLGRFSGPSNEQFIPTSATTFDFVGVATLAAANGDELYFRLVGSGVTTSAITTTSADTLTVVGGTGRFAEATGTLSERVHSIVLSKSSTSETTFDIAAVHGTISY